MWVATDFRSFLNFNINNFRHSTQLSSLIIPTKRHLNATECFLLYFCFYVHIRLFQLALRAIWNNQSKKPFSNNDQPRRFHGVKIQQNVFHCRHTVDKRVARCYLNGFLIHAKRKLWPKSENLSKNHHIWNNFGPRSPTVGGRGRPPFVENIAKNLMPHCLSLGGRLFLRGFWQSRRGKGPTPSL